METSEPLWNCVSWLQNESSAVNRKKINMGMATDSFSLLCLNLTCDSNVGNMVRTACMLGCKNFYTAGRRKWDKRSAVGAHYYINVQHLDDIYNCLIDTHHAINCDCGECKVINTDMLCDFIKSIGATPIFVEQGGVSVLEKSWTLGHNRVIFIYGNEGHGIPHHVIKKVKQTIPDTLVVSVPQLGVMRSHNVATACSIVLWEYNRRRLLDLQFELL